jgi:hypothetical protein
MNPSGVQKMGDTPFHRTSARPSGVRDTCRG